MIAQLDLAFPRNRERHTEEELARLVEYLSWAPSWRTAKQIGEDLGLNDRMIRKLAEASNGRILGTDSGYRLTHMVTPEEFGEWQGRYNSQIKRMLERLQRTTAFWHKSV